MPPADLTRLLLRAAAETVRTTQVRSLNAGESPPIPVTVALATYRTSRAAPLLRARRGSRLLCSLPNARRASKPRAIRSTRPPSLLGRAPHLRDEEPKEHRLERAPLRLLSAVAGAPPFSSAPRPFKGRRFAPRPPLRVTPRRARVGPEPATCEALTFGRRRVGSGASGRTCAKSPRPPPGARCAPTSPFIT